jgi:hypothetical protein
VLESGFGIQYDSSQGYTKFNREEIVCHVEQCVGEIRSVGTPPTLLRLKDKFHNSFEVLKSSFGIK